MFQNFLLIDKLIGLKIIVMFFLFVCMLDYHYKKNNNNLQYIRFLKSNCLHESMKNRAGLREAKYSYLNGFK